MASSAKRRKQQTTAQAGRAAPARAAVTAPALPLSVRLANWLRTAEREGRGAQAEAINAVIVALSDAKHKAGLARCVVAGIGLAALMDEIGSL